MKRGLWRGTWLGLMWVVAWLTVEANQISYQQGCTNSFVTNYNGTADAFINSASPNSNYGQYGMRITPTTQEGLLRFDLSSLAGKFTTVNSISLRFDLTQIQGSVTNGTLQAYAISSANSGWVEGTAFGATQTGSSSWNYKKTSTTVWAGLAGLGTADVDYDSTLLGSVDYSGTGFYTMILSGDTSRLTTLVSSWTNATNAGVLFKEANAARDGFTYVYGKGDLYKSQMPLLTLDYSLIPEPGSCVLVFTGLCALLGLRRLRAV